MMQLPKINLCAMDRIIRGAMSVALIVYSIFWYEHIGDVLLISLLWVFSILNLISFAIGWCPVYHIANITTCKTKE